MSSSISSLTLSVGYEAVTVVKLDEVNDEAVVLEPGRESTSAEFCSQFDSIDVTNEIYSGGRREEETFVEDVSLPQDDTTEVKTSEEMKMNRINEIKMDR